MIRNKIYRNDTALILIAFAAFFILTVGIAFLGIIQVYSLNETIRELGYWHLPRERVILEMKINNEAYAAAVRNKDRDAVKTAAADFKKYLSLYDSFAVSRKQKRWVKVLESSMAELEGIAEKTVSFLKNRETTLFFPSFETKSFAIYELLSGPLTKDNLERIEEQLQLARRTKDTSVWILIISLAMSTVLGIMITYIVYTSLKRERQRREMLVRRMIRLEEEERKNLSRQVHDQLSQDLGALKIYLELLSKSITPEQKEQKEKIEQSKEILARLIDKGHNISELLRPPELDDLGLVESIGSLIKGYRDITEGKYKYYKPDTEVTLFPEYSLALYRVTQEALTNIAKHADARNVTVSLQKKGTSLYLTIRDDGKGFDYQRHLKRPHRRKDDRMKLGLNGLRERIELLNGHLSVETTPGKGTKIDVELSV